LYSVLIAAQRTTNFVQKRKLICPKNHKKMKLNALKFAENDGFHHCAFFMQDDQHCGGGVVGFEPSSPTGSTPNQRYEMIVDNTKPLDPL